MKVAFLCCVLILAGSASCSSAEAKSISLSERFPDLVIPDNIVEWIQEQIANLPNSIENIIDSLPAIIEAIPNIIDKIEDIVELIIEKIPEIIPIIIDKIPEIIAQVPAIVDKIRAIIGKIIEKIPELIPIILDKIPEIIAAIPEIVDKIKEILGDLEMPDWFPTLPDLDKPEWWPEEIPSLPEHNKPVPGTPTTVIEYPSIVQIEVGTGPVWIQGCVGSILTNMHLISSARCFAGIAYSSRFRRIRAGSSTRFEGAIVQVDRAINHPSFKAGSFEGDISVVRLASFLTFGPTIQQVPIVPQDFNLPSGFPVVNVGWGSTAQGGLVSNRNLYEIDLQSIDRADCEERWNRIPLITIPISSDKICVARPETGGRNFDVRDMGAPIHYDGILTGVVSFGALIGNQKFPVVATSIASYTNWIVDNAV